MPSQQPLPPPASVLADLVVDDASLRQKRSEPPAVLYWLSFAFCIVVAAGIAICLAQVLITNEPFWAAISFAWLFIGGLIAGTALVLGIIYTVIASSRGFSGITTRRSITSIALPIVNGLLGIGLFAVTLPIMQAAPGVGMGGRPRVAPAPAPAIPPLVIKPRQKLINLTLINFYGIELDEAAAIMPTGKRLPVTESLNPLHIRLEKIPLEGTGPMLFEFRSGEVRWMQPSGVEISNGVVFSADYMMHVDNAELRQDGRVRIRPKIGLFYIARWDRITQTETKISIAPDGVVSWSRWTDPTTLKLSAQGMPLHVTPMTTQSGKVRKLTENELNALARDLEGLKIWPDGVQAPVNEDQLVCIYFNGRATVGGTNLPEEAWALVERIERIVGPLPPIKKAETVPVQP